MDFAEPGRSEYTNEAYACGDYRPLNGEENDAENITEKAQQDRGKGCAYQKIYR